MASSLAYLVPGFRGFLARMGLVFAIAALYVAMALPGQGRSLQFPAYDLRCDIPDDWTVGQAKGLLVRAVSPFETQGFIMGCQRAPLSATVDDPQYVQDFQDGFAKGSNGQITHSGYVVMNNIRFFFFDTKAENAATTGYFHTLLFLGNGMLYSFSIFKADGNPMEDEQLASILKSCDFIQAPTPHTGVLTIWDIFHPVDQKEHSVTERFVYALETCGQLLLIFLCPLFFYLGLTLLFYRLLFKKGRAAPPPGGLVRATLRLHDPMRRLFLVACGVMLGAILPLSARTFSFPEQNFQCEIPDTWTVIKATGSEVSAQSPTGRESFELLTGLLTDGLTIDSDEFHESIRALFTRQGYAIKGPSYVTLQGRRFAFWQLVPPDPNPFDKPIAWAWVIIADGRLYILKPTCDENPTANPEISGIVNSFQFITTPQIPDAAWGELNLAGTPRGDGEVHRMISPAIIIAVIFCLFAGPAIAIGLVIFFIRRHERKRHSVR